MLELIGLDQLTNVNKGKISKLEKFTRNEINTMAIYGLMKLYCNFVENTNTNYKYKYILRDSEILN